MQVPLTRRVSPGFSLFTTSPIVFWALQASVCWSDSARPTGTLIQTNTAASAMVVPLIVRIIVVRGIDDFLAVSLRLSLMVRSSLSSRRATGPTEPAFRGHVSERESVLPRKRKRAAKTGTVEKRAKMAAFLPTPMKPERWKQVESLYHAARTRPPRERTAFLTDRCRDDESLRRDVESLLNEPVSDDGLLVPPAAAVERVTSVVTPAAMSGYTLGGYHLQTLLGAGGMGEVYRAHDNKLGREVAIKVLPAEFTADPERRARLEREARILATLNHPHIGAIYGIEEADGVRGLVLELVEGETLAERIANGRTSPRVRFAWPTYHCCARDRAADRGRARRRSRERHRSPRPEAGEHQDHPGRRGQGARFRPGEGGQSRRLAPRAE